MNNAITDIDAEPESVGRVSLDEVRSDPEIIRKKVEAKVMSILDKYGYTLALADFRWTDGQVQAVIEFVEKPSEIFAERYGGPVTLTWDGWFTELEDA